MADDDLADFSDEQWEDFLARSHALKTQVKTVDAASESEDKIDLPPKVPRGYSCLENVHHSATSVIHAASIVAFL